MSDFRDVVVVGGGQAGLAMGWQLARLGLDFVILDAGSGAGHAWRVRWDSLRLFTPARYSALPGLSFPADPDHYPTKDEVAEYLAGYVHAFGLPLRSGERVLSLSTDTGGAGFRLTTERSTYLARQVVVATGAFHAPATPRFARGLGTDVVQLHSSEYRNPEQLPPGPALVVGGGNSGFQIAAELAATRRTHLAVGERQSRMPERLLGRSVFSWLDRVGAMDVRVDTRVGKRMSRKNLLVGMSPRVIQRTHGVGLLGRALGAEKCVVRTEESGRTEVAGVVWATGFRQDIGWIDLPVLDTHGMPIQSRGVTAVPGLYFLGIPWMHTRGSGLIGWVGRDAGYLAERIAELHSRRTRFRAG